MIRYIYTHTHTHDGTRWKEQGGRNKVEGTRWKEQGTVLRVLEKEWFVQRNENGVEKNL